MPATSSEWALAFSVSFFFATYIPEFRQFHVTPVIIFRSTPITTGETDKSPDLISRKQLDEEENDHRIFHESRQLEPI